MVVKWILKHFFKENLKFADENTIGDLHLTLTRTTAYQRIPDGWSITVPATHHNIVVSSMGCRKGVVNVYV